MPAIISREVSISCSNHTPAIAVISGTLSCATIAMPVVMQATAAYQIT